jgi:LSD1 subclass zinc finger protein
MSYSGTSSPSGAVNNTTVKCSQCGTTNYVIGSKVSSMGGWKCYACGKEHR